MLKKTKEIIIQNKRVIVFFIAIVVFIIIAKALFKEQLYEFDNYVYIRIIKYMNPYVTQVLKIFTNLGGAIALIIASLTMFICLKNRKIGKYVIINLVIITCINQILKYIFARERPNILRLVEEHGYSFPSRTFYGKYGILWIFNIFTLD
mgnify:CR=1 FL=1